ncbi:hypothetical protein 8P_015 [Pseudomonas phage 8P]|nr:hypothetical protein 8P_015 [Pseudomonas phage 8P]
MAAHRFWGLHISANWGDSNYTSLAELVLAPSAGGAQGAVGGTAIASSFRIAAESPDKAFDGSPTTSWRTTVGGNIPAFIGYDMGAGNSLDVAEVRMTTLSTMGATSYPRGFALVYSDDGVKWGIQKGWSEEAFATGVERVFDTTPVQANQVYNRVLKEPARRNDQANVGPPTLRMAMPFGLMGGGLRHHTAPRMKAPFTGNYFIQGTTTALGEPLARRVDLYDQRSGQLVRQVFSKADGAFLFDYIGPGPWTVVGVDSSAEQNSVIYAHITPSPMT